MAVGSAGGLGDTASAALAVGRVDGGIEVRNPFNGVVQWKVPGDPQGGKAAAIRGLHLIYSGPAAGSGAGGGAAAPLALSCTQGGVSRVHAAGEEGGAAVVASWAAPADVFCTAFDPGSGLLAVGAQGTELRLYDAAAGGQPAFVAKGGRPNAVGLPDRPWNSAAAFLPGGGGSKVVVGTGYRKLRLYDSKAGKRPQLDVAFGEARVTALAPQADGARGPLLCSPHFPPPPPPPPPPPRANFSAFPASRRCSARGAAVKFRR
jgi:ribosome biogenesis protein NSA1